LDHSLIKIEAYQKNGGGGVDMNYSITGRGRFNPICPSFASPSASPNKKWATA